jgi:hypothetical protein
MFAALASGQEPYPEPAQPPLAPAETPPIDTPQEEPPATPFSDDGRTIDWLSPLSTSTVQDGGLAA